MRDSLAKWLIDFAIGVVATKRTGARLEVAFRKGAGAPIPERLRERADLAREAGQ